MKKREIINLKEGFGSIPIFPLYFKIVCCNDVDHLLFTFLPISEKNNCDKLHSFIPSQYTAVIVCSFSIFFF